MGVWAILTMATHLSLHKLQVLGDSKVVIDCLSKKGRLRASVIENWILKILDLIKDLQEIIFQHIYMEHNKEEDNLSKKAL
jgi:hypothetical protein